MPQESISDRQCVTVCFWKTRSSVSGQMPPLASVAATTDICSHVISREQYMK